GAIAHNDSSGGSVMGYSPGVGVDTSIGLLVGFKEPVDLSVSREHGGACLVLGDHVAEIRLEPPHLETLRDRLPGVLADLGLLDAADQRAADAGSRTHELERYLRDQAAASDTAGRPERAGELRGRADNLAVARQGLESALDAVSEAALAADGA